MNDSVVNNGLTEEIGADNIKEGELESVKNVKVPSFWTHNPKLWFVHVEAQFISNNIKGDLSRYYTVISSLDCSTLQQVCDLLEKPPASGKYDALKTVLINTYADSNERQLKKLLTEIELGDQKPSQLLRHMKSLANDQIREDALRTLWMQRLPSQVQLILSASQGVDINKMAEIADKIVEVSTNSAMAASVANVPAPAPAMPNRDCAATPLTPVLPHATAHDIAALQSQVASLTRMVEELRVDRSRPRSRSQGRWRPRSRSKTPGARTECFYHRRFGSKARKCTAPCSYKAPN